MNDETTQALRAENAYLKEEVEKLKKEIGTLKMILKLIGKLTG